MAANRNTTQPTCVITRSVQPELHQSAESHTDLFVSFNSTSESVTGHTSRGQLLHGNHNKECVTRTWFIWYFRLVDHNHFLHPYLVLISVWWAEASQHQLYFNFQLLRFNTVLHSSLWRHWGEECYLHQFRRYKFRQSSRKPAVSDLYEVAVPLELVDWDGCITHWSLFLLSTVGDTTEGAGLKALPSHDWTTSTLVGWQNYDHHFQTYWIEPHC